MDQPESETIRLAWEAEERAQRTGDPGDLLASVTAWPSAVEVTAQATASAAYRAEILNQAAGALLRRHQATREDIGDLGVAHHWLEKTIALTPEHAPERLLYLSNAGGAAFRRRVVFRQDVWKNSCRSWPAVPGWRRTRSGT